MSENDRNMHAFLQAIKLYEIPGLSLALVQDQTITTFEFGVKNTYSQEPVTSTTVFEGASLSKPLVAYAALKLCRQGVLDLDRPLSPLDLGAVTLRHILSHTGGFPTANLKPGELLKLDPNPGSQFAYSGESFRYLGKIIEHITRIPLASYMQEHVFGPLKMENSSFVWEECYDALAASPHNQKGNPLEKWKPDHAIASFSLHTTAADFAKFMIAAGQFPEMSETNFKINKALSWGLGWEIETDSYGRKGLWHSGDNGSFQCLAFQNQQSGFVIMTNSPHGMKIYRKALDLFVGGIHPLLDWEQFDARAVEELDEEFLANWWKKIMTDQLVLKKRTGASVNAYLILKQEGKILFHLRKNTGYYDGMWSLVAGHVEDGESAFSGMIREAREEIGIELLPSQLKVVHVLHRQSNRFNVDIFFECSSWKGTPQNREPEKCEKLEFFALDALPSNIVEYNAAVLKAIQHGEIYSESGWTP